MRQVKFVLVLFVVALAGCHCPSDERSPSGSPPPAGWYEESIEAGGMQRWFRVYVPHGLQTKAPVVVVLHGGTQSMRRIFSRYAGGYQAWLDVAEGEKVLLLVPNGINPENGDPKGDYQNWNDLRPTSSDRDSQADDVGFINTLLDWVEENCSVDPKRIYVTGASNGGMMTFRLLIETPERFAAGAAFIATLPEDTTLLMQPSEPTPLVIANGTEDPVVKWAGGRVRGRSLRTMSSEATVAWWVEANRADGTASSTAPLPDADPNNGCLIHKTVYPASGNGAPVVFYRIEGGGHTIPSIKYEIPMATLLDRVLGPMCRDAEGAQLAWQFMKDKRR